MAREKKAKDLKGKVILIRVNKADKETAEKLSSLAGQNTSEFFRELLYDRKAGNTFFNRLEKIVKKMEAYLGPEKL